MKTTPLPSPPMPSVPPTAGTIGTGLPVPAIDRLRIMGPGVWTDFILEWVDSLKAKYEQVERCDGAGDMGRDIIAFQKQVQPSSWDNYQCKHYDHPLEPGDIWLELGKFCYYTHIGEFTVPHRYHFVAPQGAGPTVSKLLRTPQDLRKKLLENWDKHCAAKITTTKKVPLDSALKAHIESLDFSIFTAPSPLTIIQEHGQTRWHAARFGGGLRPRPKAPPPPTAIDPSENNYVRALLDAYGDKLRAILSHPGQISDDALIEHFKRARIEFYSAEALKGFSRDNVPPGTYEALLDDVFNGVVDVWQSTHPDSYARVLATVKHAKLLPFVSTPLASAINQPDRGGMCHQLANELKLKWKL